MGLTKILRAVIVTGLVFSICSCTEKLTYCHFDDTVINSKEERGAFVALGYKGIYVLRGRYQIFGKVGSPGQLLGYSGVFEFSVEEFLSKYPQFKTPELEKLAKKQASRLKRKKHEPEVSKIVGPPVGLSTAADSDPSAAGKKDGSAVQLSE